MSLYNQLFGVNPKAPVILKMAGLALEEIPRFRDSYVKGGNIVVYTRTGGGNREGYEQENGSLAAKPNYVKDYDDDFDSTYAYFEFKPLPEYEELVAALETNEPSIGDKFKDLVAKMKEAP